MLSWNKDKHRLGGVLCNNLFLRHWSVRIYIRINMKASIVSRLQDRRCVYTRELGSVCSSHGICLIQITLAAIQGKQEYEFGTGMGMQSEALNTVLGAGLQD